MGKIGDIWVKLGIKKEEYDKGIKDAEKTSASFGANIKKMGAVAKSVWAAVGVAVIAVAKDILNSSNVLGDAFQHTWDKAKAGWELFKSSLIQWDWDDWGKKFKKAMEASEALSSANDAAYEVSNSVKLMRARMAEELAQLEIDMRNVNLSYEQRLAAGKKYLAMIKDTYNVEIQQAKKLMEANIDYWEATAQGAFPATKIKREDIINFIQAYGADEGYSALLGQIAPLWKEAADKEVQFYSDIIARNIASTRGYARQKAKNEAKGWAGEDWQLETMLNRPGNEALKELVSRLNMYEEKYGISKYVSTALQNIYENSKGDAANTPMIQSIIDYFSMLAAQNQDTKRIQTLINTLQAQVAKNVEVAAETVPDPLGEPLQRLTDKIQGFAQSGFTMPDIIPDDWLTRNREKIDETMEMYGRLEAAAEELWRGIEQGMSNSIDALAEALAGVEGANAGSVIKAMLTPLADAAIRAGMIILGVGEGVEALKSALFSLNGPAAIVAGAALIAIGFAAKVGLAAIGKGSTSSGYTSTGSNYGTGDVETSDMSSELTIYVKGTLSGRDIVLSGERTISSWAR